MKRVFPLLLLPVILLALWLLAPKPPQVQPDTSWLLAFGESSSQYTLSQKLSLKADDEVFFFRSRHHQFKVYWNDIVIHEHHSLEGKGRVKWYMVRLPATHSDGEIKLEILNAPNPQQVPFDLRIDSFAGSLQKLLRDDGIHIALTFLFVLSGFMALTLYLITKRRAALMFSFLAIPLSIYFSSAIESRYLLIDNIDFWLNLKLLALFALPLQLAMFGLELSYRRPWTLFSRNAAAVFFAIATVTSSLGLVQLQAFIPVYRAFVALIIVYTVVNMIVHREQINANESLYQFSYLLLLASISLGLKEGQECHLDLVCWTSLIFLLISLYFAIHRIILRNRGRSSSTLGIKLNHQSYEEKLQALAHMAGGIAHEINNPLAIISGYTRNLNRINVDESDRPQFEKIIKRIQGSTDRIHFVTESFLQMAAGNTFEDGDSIPSAAAIENAILLCQSRILQMSIQVKTDINLKVRTRCPSHLLSQVTFILLNNAIDAVEKTFEPQISITCTAADGIMRLSICDNGVGFSKDVSDRIAEPFFTTKDVGKGSGLNLSLAMAIVNQHQGRLSWYRKNQSTCFQVELPTS
ncbi:sensor histidine kinase [Pseudobacteriovorax antillogorgiicola]|uniref:histidine kinase n=1 Tax=Pseudobacteriovorax antillogorgiicola TaxID=1513793 RepID=A0A1Y6CEP7_9BACT|nr:sensor histidine kinase [Pseudobacteriovorax antillogorgiicola]TCS47669.1 phospho-acceptor domain-containing protein [Pseudobacteriovorax antillogorgiicola]SMF59642.1 His Kinase A (phospho-acceptor) domain-containing protein [Pseudobacteriovorax antillogorgiicola]